MTNKELRVLNVPVIGGGPRKGWTDRVVTVDLELLISSGKLETHENRVKTKIKTLSKRDAKKKKDIARKEAAMARQNAKNRILTKPESERGSGLGSDEFYKSREWRSVRYDVICASSGKCVLCGRFPTDDNEVVLHVDHINPRSDYPDLELDPANLQVLCMDCNLGKSNKDSIDWRTVRL